MSKYEETLIGNSMHIMEIDDEDDKTNEDAQVDADFVDIVDHLGTEEFKYIYLNLYDEIRSGIDIDRQRELCEQLETKIFELYGFEFTPKIIFETYNDVNKFLKFIEFLEFDNIWFLSEIITGLDFDLLKRDLDKFLSLNWNEIDLKINYLIQNEKISELISKFLRTNNKEGIIEFVRSNLEKNKMLAILKTMEGEFQNE